METNWINHPTVIEGELVKLVPLDKSNFDALYKEASDPKLWEHIPFDCSVAATFNKQYTAALGLREKGGQYPFVTIHKPTGRIIGSTRLLDIHPEDKRLEIGYTWVIQEFWGTAVNIECKYLLLRFCFETLGANRVQIKTDALNIRSRTAILKIGGQFEGILRKDRLRENGIIRNTAYYSVINDEWPAVKERLQNMLTERNVSIISHSES